MIWLMNSLLKQAGQVDERSGDSAFVIMLSNILSTGQNGNNQLSSA
jgi:hypothetical protein